VIGPGGEVDGAALLVLLGEVLKQRLVIGEMVCVKRGAGRNLCFYQCFAAFEPGEEMAQAQGLVAKKDTEGIMKSVGFDQSAIQVHTEWYI